MEKLSRLFDYLFAALVALFGSPVALRLAVAFVAFVMLNSGTVHAATGTFDPGSSWTEWLEYYAASGVQVVLGWFGYCVVDPHTGGCMAP